MNIVDWVFAKLEEIIDPVDGVVPGPRIETPVATKRIREDQDSPNLFVDKIIEDSSIKCRVLATDPDNSPALYPIRVEILEIYWERLGTYLDIGKDYPLRRVFDSHNHEMMVWEIPPEFMKRDTSQVLLAWEKDLGWTWDLDM